MKKSFYLFILISLSVTVHAQSGRSVLGFDENWTFNLGDVPTAKMLVLMMPAGEN